MIHPCCLCVSVLQFYGQIEFHFVNILYFCLSIDEYLGHLTLMDDEVIMIYVLFVCVCVPIFSFFLVIYLGVCMKLLGHITLWLIV